MGIFLDIAKVLANLDNVSEFVAEKGFSEALRAKTVKDLIDELNGLSSRKIAEFLSDMGYNGEVGDAELNPVVAYINDSFPEVNNVWADWEEGYYGYITDGGDVTGDRYVIHELLPYNVSQFLEDYSEGLYGDLFEDGQDIIESELDAWDEGSDEDEWDDFDDEDLEDESDDESDEFEDEDLDIDESDDEDELEEDLDDGEDLDDDSDLDEDEDFGNDDFGLSVPSKDEYSQQEADNAWKKVSGLFRKYLK